MKNEKYSAWPSGIRGFFFLLIILALFFGYEMGNRPFASPDEGRYIEIPREMVVTDDYVTPRLDGMKYFEKPPLFYWMQAAAIKTLGINETSMRCGVVLFAILGCLSVFAVGALAYGSSVGILSTGILATSLIYYAHSHIIILDLVLSVLLSGCLWAFFLAFVKETPPTISRKSLIIAMYALSALACLTKGLIGAVLPGFVAFIWMLFTKNLKVLKDALYIPGILIFLAIFLPWHILVASRNDDFLHFYFFVEHFLRYTTTVHGRYQPVWFFIPIILGGMLPWTGFLFPTFKNLTKNMLQKKSEDTFLACWIFGIFIFFSLSHSKLVPYILPIIQPIALILGRAFAEENFRDFKIGAAINIFLIIGICCAYPLIQKLIGDVLAIDDVRILLNATLGILLAIAIVFSLAFFEKISQRIAVVLCIFLSGNMLWTINKAAPYYQQVRKPTVREVAKAVRMNKTKDDQVFVYDHYYQDAPVYVEDTVGVINAVGELYFGAEAEPSKSKLIDEDSFWKLWKTSSNRIFLILSRQDYRKVFSKGLDWHKIVKFDENFIAIVNK